MLDNRKQIKIKSILTCYKNIREVLWKQIHQTSLKRRNQMSEWGIKGRAKMPVEKKNGEMG